MSRDISSSQHVFIINIIYVVVEINHYLNTIQIEEIEFFVEGNELMTFSTCAVLEVYLRIICNFPVGRYLNYDIWNIF